MTCRYNVDEEVCPGRCATFCNVLACFVRIISGVELVLVGLYLMDLIQLKPPEDYEVMEEIEEAESSSTTVAFTTLGAGVANIVNALKEMWFGSCRQYCHNRCRVGPE